MRSACWGVARRYCPVTAVASRLYCSVGTVLPASPRPPNHTTPTPPTTQPNPTRPALSHPSNNYQDDPSRPSLHAKSHQPRQPPLPLHASQPTTYPDRCRPTLPNPPSKSRASLCPFPPTTSSSSLLRSAKVTSTFRFRRVQIGTNQVFSLMNVTSKSGWRKNNEAK